MKFNTKKPNLRVETIAGGQPVAESNRGHIVINTDAQIEAAKAAIEAEADKPTIGKTIAEGTGEIVSQSLIELMSQAVQGTAEGACHAATGDVLAAMLDGLSI
jgi:hypothetical protein